MTLFATGFRPFFLLAALLAVVQMPLWVLGQLQVLPPPGDVAWHAHEMLFGFTVAVIAGFLLTAARNWTGKDTASGSSLACLSALWLAGRIAMALVQMLPAWLVAVIDLSFLPALGFFVARPIVLARQWRQLAILGILGAIFAANVTFHISPEHRRWAWLIALDLVLVLIVIIGGRVIPMFTRNATGVAITPHRWIERMSMGTMALLVVAELLRQPTLVGGACLFAGVAQSLRLYGWLTRRAARLPILWVLHKGYGWLALGLLFRGAAQFCPCIPESAAIHLMTTGAVGMLVLGMMARVALGHTGRDIVAPRAVVVAFVLVALAAAARAFVPMLTPRMTSLAFAVAGSAWTAAFALYLLSYARMLWSPRLDGRPG